jgi:hypothetical protein
MYHAFVAFIYIYKVIEHGLDAAMKEWRDPEQTMHKHQDMMDEVQAANIEKLQEALKILRPSKCAAQSVKLGGGSG